MTAALTASVWKDRVDGADWAHIAAQVGELGGALTPQLLSPGECDALAGLYDHQGRFRSVVNMERYRFGAGEYKYFAPPLPEPVEQLKQALYPRLLQIARDWYRQLGRPAPWPGTLDEWLAMCHAAGQVKSTAILLKYGAGDWNALHRDLYGDLVFPLQGVVNLSRPGIDHTGGSSCCSSSGPGPSPAAPPRSSRPGTGWCSPPVTGP